MLSPMIARSEETRITKIRNRLAVTPLMTATRTSSLIGFTEARLSAMQPDRPDGAQSVEHRRFAQRVGEAGSLADQPGHRRRARAGEHQ